MRLIRVEIAGNEDGQRIKKLVLDSGVASVEDLDWADIHPYWLKALRGPRIVGAIQVLPGKPIGRLELLAVDDKLPHRIRAKVVMELLMQGFGVLKGHGAQMASGMLPFEARSYKRILKKRGGVVILSGNTMAFRLI